MHLLPEPEISARCGVCFSKLSWSTEACQFECSQCLLKIVPDSDGRFKTDYQSPLQTICGKHPPKTMHKVRYLRRNDAGERVFKTFLYVYLPCSLPNNHYSQHYFYYTSTYTEELVTQNKTDSLPVIDITPETLKLIREEQQPENSYNSDEVDKE